MKYIVVCSDPNGDNPNMYFGPYDIIEDAEKQATLSNASYVDEETGEIIGCPNEHHVAELREGN